MSWRRFLGRPLPFEKTLLTFQDEEGEGGNRSERVSTLRGKGRRESQARPEPKRGNLSATREGVWRTLTLSRWAEICFSTTKYVWCSEKLMGSGKTVTTNQSSKPALSGKFHLGPLKKNDTKTQQYVKQEKETNGARLIRQDVHP